MALILLLNHYLELNVRRNIVQVRRRQVCPQQLNRDRVRDKTPSAGSTTERRTRSPHLSSGLAATPVSLRTDPSVARPDATTLGTTRIASESMASAADGSSVLPSR